MLDNQILRKSFHVPSKGVVDDRNTLESQMVGGHHQTDRHRVASKSVQIKKYLPRFKDVL